MFNELSSNNLNLENFLKTDDIYSGGRKWLKELQHIISKSFKKIRISKTKPPLKKETSVLFRRRENIKSRMAG